LIAIHDISQFSFDAIEILKHYLSAEQEKDSVLLIIVQLYSTVIACRMCDGSLFNE
jgi:hypothetical protein